MLSTTNLCVTSYPISVALKQTLILRRTDKSSDTLHESTRNRSRPSHRNTWDEKSMLSLGQQMFKTSAEFVTFRIWRRGYYLCSNTPSRGLHHDGYQPISKHRNRTKSTCVSPFVNISPSWYFDSTLWSDTRLDGSATFSRNQWYLMA